MIQDKFIITNKVCIITGGGGLIGKCHMEAVLDEGRISALIGRIYSTLDKARSYFEEKYSKPNIELYEADITNKEQLYQICDELWKNMGILIFL